MSAALVIWMTFISVALFVAATIAWSNDAFFGYRSRLTERMRSGSGPGGGAASSVFYRVGKPNGETDTSWRARFERYYARSGIACDVKRFYTIALATAASTALFAAAMTGSWWGGPAGFATAIVASAGLVVLKHRSRARKLVSQLPKAIDIISRAVRAGQTVPAAFQIVADDLESPLSDEFRCCYEQQNLGMSHESALRSLAARTEIMELRILVVGLLVQARSGGNLIGLLDNLSSLLQKRFKLEHRVRALTGEGRLQANVLTVLPTAALGALYVIAPDYIATLLRHPSLLGVSFAAQAVGAVWIRQCVKIDY